jgi:hypothetical protein
VQINEQSKNVNEKSQEGGAAAMSPDVYPSEKHFQEVLTQLEYWDQVIVMDWIRGEIGRQTGKWFWFVVFSFILGFLIGRWWP